MISPVHHVKNQQENVQVVLIKKYCLRIVAWINVAKDFLKVHWENVSHARRNARQVPKIHASVIRVMMINTY